MAAVKADPFLGFGEENLLSACLFQLIRAEADEEDLVADDTKAGLARMTAGVDEVKYSLV